MFPDHVHKNLCKARGKEIGSHERPKRDKCKEIAVVAAANTIIEPDTMMIMSLDAVIANPAMMTTRWSPDVAGFAVFDWHLHGGVG